MFNSKELKTSLDNMEKLDKILERGLEPNLLKLIKNTARLTWMYPQSDYPESNKPK